MNSGKPVIVVVEDEVLIRLMAVAIAEDAGFEVYRLQFLGHRVEPYAALATG